MKSGSPIIATLGIFLLLVNSSTKYFSPQWIGTLLDATEYTSSFIYKNESLSNLLPLTDTWNASEDKVVVNGSEVTVQFVNHGPSPSQRQRQQQQQYSLAQMCRLDIENWLNQEIDLLLQMGDEMPPMIDWVWDMGTYFLVNIKFHRVLTWNRKAFMEATWNWQDQFGNNFTVKEIMGKEQALRFTNNYAIYAPSNKWGVTLARLEASSTANQTERSIPTSLWASNVQPPNAKTVRHWVNDLRPFVKCDQIENELDRPAPDAKIGMCVRFRGDHHLLPPFIAYHRIIGVDHFWFYANEPFNITDLPVAPDVTYVPYNFVFSDHANHTRVTYHNGEMGPWKLPFDGDNFWQQDVQQQCLYRAKRYGMDWLMTNDVDEYLWLNKSESNKFHEANHSATPNRSILKQFLQEFEKVPQLGALGVDGWAFGYGTEDFLNNANDTQQLPIDCTYRTEEPGVGGRKKLIYRVPTANRIGVHWLIEGGNTVNLPIADVRWNHYRSPSKGIFGRNSTQEIVQDSSLRDTYRTAVVKSIQRDAYPSMTLASRRSLY